MAMGTFDSLFGEGACEALFGRDKPTPWDCAECKRTFHPISNHRYGRSMEHLCVPCWEKLGMPTPNQHLLGQARR